MLAKPIGSYYDLIGSSDRRAIAFDAVSVEQSSLAKHSRGVEHYPVSWTVAVKRAVRFIHTWVLLSLFPQMPSGVFL